MSMSVICLTNRARRFAKITLGHMNVIAMRVTFYRVIIKLVEVYLLIILKKLIFLLIKDVNINVNRGMNLI